MTTKQIEQHLDHIESLGDGLLSDTIRALLDRITALEERLRELEGELCPSGADSPFLY